MVPALSVRVLCQTPLFQMRDVRCRPTCSSCGPDEYSEDSSFVFIRRGAFVRSAGKKEHFADANRILFFRQNEGYRVRHPVAGGDDCTALTFAPEVLWDAFGSQGGNDDKAASFSTGQMPHDGVSLSILHHLRTGLKAGHLSALECEEAALAILGRIAQSLSAKCDVHFCDRESTRRAHQTLVFDTLSLLSARLREPLSLVQIARAVHSTPFHLSRVFSKALGMPIHQHLLRLRLAAALDALSEGATDLTSIAVEHGFSSHSHFSSAFCRIFAISPSRTHARATPKRLSEMSKILKAHRVRSN